MNRETFDMIIGEMERAHKSLIKAMKNCAKREDWGWALPTDSPGAEQFNYVHQLDKDRATHYREIIRLTKEKYED